MDHKVSNLIKDIPETRNKEEVFQQILSQEGVRIERIISSGHSSPVGYWYDQDENEWVVLLEGCAGIKYPDGSQIHLNPGDHIFLPAHAKHRVAYTSSEPVCIWLAVFWKVTH